jgi:hypothetical protein
MNVFRFTTKHCGSTNHLNTIVVRTGYGNENRKYPVTTGSRVWTEYLKVILMNKKKCVTVYHRLLTDFDIVTDWVENPVELQHFTEPLFLFRLKINSLKFLAMRIYNVIPVSYSTGTGIYFVFIKYRYLQQC